MSSILHISNLLVDSSLETLHSAHISNISFSLQILIRSISEFHKFFQLFNFISFYLMFALYRLWTAHWTWLVNTKYNWYIFFPINLFILNLCSCFKNIVHSFILWFFLIFNRYFIVKITKFTFPILIILTIGRINNANIAMNIKVSLAFFTRNWITSSKFSFVSKSWKSYFKNIGINFLSELSCRLLFPFSFFFFHFTLLTVNITLILAIRKIKATVKIIWINSFTWSIINIILFLV